MHALYTNLTLRTASVALLIVSDDTYHRNTPLCGIDLLSGRKSVLTCVRRCVLTCTLDLQAVPPSETRAMFRIGGRSLHEPLSRICCSHTVPTCAVQGLTPLVSAPACTYTTSYVPCQPSSALASRQFATSSLEKYDPQGGMSAVTFHGSRTMKVSKKPKPRLQTPKVRMQNPSTCYCYSARIIPAIAMLDHCKPRSMQSCCKDHCSLQDVIVKVTMSSICGSDMHPYAGRGVVLDSGITFGHEYTGIIVAVGDEVRFSLAEIYSHHKYHDTAVASQVIRRCHGQLSSQACMMLHW